MRSETLVAVTSHHPPLPARGGPPVFTELAAQRLERKREAALGYRIMASWGWGADGSGHITARDPEREDCFWLLGYGVPFGEATVDDLVLVDERGDVVEGHLEINRSAYFIHAPIHQARPDVTGAIHTHTPYGTPFSALDAPLPMSSQEACAFHDNQAVFSGAELNVADLDTGKRLAADLGDNRLLVLRNHGLLTVGQHVSSAIGFYLLAERAAEVAVKVPAGRTITASEADVVAESIGHEHNGWHVYEYLVRSRIGDRSVVG